MLSQNNNKVKNPLSNFLPEFLINDLKLDQLSFEDSFTFPQQLNSDETDKSTRGIYRFMKLS
jgi:hypothetical protein